MNIQPLQSFGRMPRCITDYLHFKASEFYNFILFYSLPALNYYLPDKYFQHWLLFVIALFNLLKDKITIQDIQEADKLFKLYVKQIEKLYSDRELSYNIHQLFQLALSVQRWGPLWARYPHFHLKITMVFLPIVFMVIST